MAGWLSDAWLDDLRSRTNIVEVVSEYVTLKQKGRRHWGLCPFHSEKTGSFSVSEDNQMYYCFGCHKGGDVIGFVMEMERMEFMEAVEHLADRAHLPLPEREARAQKGVSREARESIFEVNRLAAKYFHDQLYTQEGAESLTYLYGRGFLDKDIRRFGLGASTKGWDDLTEMLIAGGYPEELLIQAGLTGKKDERRYDMFRNRVMFPIINAQGRVLGFGGRALGDAMPKYMNTSDTPVFNKRHELYALNFAKAERGLKRYILVEGYMDVLSLRRHGVGGVVATLGTALTEEQARLIGRYVPEVWVCYDGDSAGQKAILRALEIFEGTKTLVRVLDLPGGMDPDDYVKAYGAERFLSLPTLKPVEYRMIRAEDDLDLGTEEGREQFAIRACELLRTVKNPVERENYVKKLIVKTGFPKEVLMEQIGVMPVHREPVKKSRRLKNAVEDVSELERAERMLVMLLGNRLINSQAVSETDFETPLYLKMAGLLLNDASPAAVLNAVDEDEREAAARALNDEAPPDEKNALQMAEDCLRVIRRYRIEKDIEQLKEEMANADEGDKRNILLKIAEFMREMQNLKTGRKEWTV